MSNAPLAEQLDHFWNEQMVSVQQLCESDKDFKNHNDLPLARIKRIMKSDEGMFSIFFFFSSSFLI
jgi:nuclear transcription factor Y, gamma